MKGRCCPSAYDAGLLAFVGIIAGFDVNDADKHSDREHATALYQE